MGKNAVMRTLHLDTLISAGDPPVRVTPAYHTAVGRHDHDFYELVYVVEGFCLQDSAGAISLLMEGDVFINKPGIDHKYMGNRVTRIYNCMFRAEALSNSMETLATLSGPDMLFDEANHNNPPCIHLTLPERNGFVHILEDMRLECDEHPLGWQVRVPAQLICLLTDYARAYARHVRVSNEESDYCGYVPQALSFIDTHYADAALSVQTIAAQSGITPDYLSRRFKQHIGLGVQEYLKRYRFARAMTLLQSDMPISEIAENIGFGSHCNFSREFKKELGITPTQYRMKYKEDNYGT